MSDTANPPVVTAAPPRTRPSPTAQAPAAKKPKTKVPAEIVVELDEEFDFAGVTTNKVTLRRPLVQDRIIVEKQGWETDIENNLAMISCLSGIPMEEFSVMPMDQLNLLLLAAKKFSPGS